MTMTLWGVRTTHHELPLTNINHHKLPIQTWDVQREAQNWSFTNGKIIFGYPSWAMFVEKQQLSSPQNGWFIASEVSIKQAGTGSMPRLNAYQTRCFTNLEPITGTDVAQGSRPAYHGWSSTVITLYTQVPLVPPLFSLLLVMILHKIDDWPNAPYTHMTGLITPWIPPGSQWTEASASEKPLPQCSTCGRLTPQSGRSTRGSKKNNK